jgi:hypothetical protein
MYWGQSLFIKVNLNSTVASHLVDALGVVRFCELIGSCLLLADPIALWANYVVISPGRALVANT